MKIPEIVLTPLENDHRITIYSVSMIGVLTIGITLVQLFLQDYPLIQMVFIVIFSVLILYYSMKVFLEYLSVNRDYIAVKESGLTIQRFPTLSFSLFPKRYENIPYKTMRKLEVISIWNPLFPGLTKKALMLTVETSEGKERIVFGDRLPDEELEKLNNALLLLSGIGEKIKQMKNRVTEFLGAFMSDLGEEEEKEGENT